MTDDATTPQDPEPAPADGAPDQAVPASEPASAPHQAVEQSQPAVQPAAQGRRYSWGTGRRKRAVARVRVCPGNGTFRINGREIDDYFRSDTDRRFIRQPLEVTNTGSHMDVFVNVYGGGTTGQAGAIVLGLARALKAVDSAHESILRDRHYLTRDSRKVERKKYGRRGARRSFQFSKR